MNSGVSFAKTAYAWHDHRLGDMALSVKGGDAMHAIRFLRTYLPLHLSDSPCQTVSRPVDGGGGRHAPSPADPDRARPSAMQFRVGETQYQAHGSTARQRAIGAGADADAAVRSLGPVDAHGGTAAG